MFDLVLAIGALGQPLPPLSVDSLRRRLDVLEARANSLSVLEAKKAELDSVVVGPLVAVGAPALLTAARPALDRVATEWTRLFGGTQTMPVWIRLETLDQWWGTRGTVLVRAGRQPDPAILGSVSVARSVVGEPIDQVYRQAMGEALGGVLLATADSSLAAWLASPPELGNDSDLDQLRYQMATVRDSTARACFDGESLECALGLGLVGPPRPLVPASVRHGLLRNLLRQGEPGGWSRLSADPARSMADRLASIGSVPLASAVDQWVRSVRTHRQSEGEPVRATVAAIWALAGLAVALRVGGRP